MLANESYGVELFAMPKAVMTRLAPVTLGRKHAYIRYKATKEASATAGSSKKAARMLLKSELERSGATRISL